MQTTTVGQDYLKNIKALLADDSKKWSLDVGDWIGYVEELVDEVERLQTEVGRWKENYHDYCDSQLDLFRKAGMTEAAKRCAEIAYTTKAPKSIGRDKGRHHAAGAQHAARRIREEFNLPKAG